MVVLMVTEVKATKMVVRAWCWQGWGRGEGGLVLGGHACAPTGPALCLDGGTLPVAPSLPHGRLGSAFLSQMRSLRTRAAVAPPEAQPVAAPSRGTRA